ncbi:hypothetical protein GE061_014613 [Apolygus lucorum]|uniref:Acylphosphatase n=1 Tax=Apolygus lucorum TaxID=248454 RepID=A0A8S9XKR8_APOLU|nr:hypothetical protein GE061_014613 [Apolygus lucorum]
MSATKSVSVDFEIFGKVQGVFFRKYTQKRALNLGLGGFVMNTSKGTVVGRIEGEQKKVKDMKQWLEKTGSPKSRIDRAVFSEEKPMTQASASGNKEQKVALSKR